ncbi:MAG: MarP family serine protease [Actinomycetia bacterium]|nr:MarP family serine protease [Actinomycetes bacterium]
MNLFDAAVVIAVALAVVGGWRLGLITRGLGWVGALLGVTFAIAIVPVLSRWLNPPSDAGVLLLTAGSFILLLTMGQAIGVAIGSRLRPHPADENLRRIDSLGGSMLGIVGVGVILWLLVPLMANTQGWVASTTRTSAFARAVTDHLPDPPPQLRDLERGLANGSFPQLFASLRPAPELPPPPEGSPVDQEVVRAVAASTARVQGEACGLVQSGSSFSVADGLWLTNAHVVAGTTSSRLTTADGATDTGTVVAFDPQLDLALIASDLTRPALQFATPSESASGLVLGFPGGGAFEPSPFLVGELLTATGYDIYDSALVRRPLLVLASDLEPGDSGSALIDAEGRVLGAAVAVAPDREGVAYALQGNAVAAILASAGEAVSTGDCIG